VVRPTVEYSARPEPLSKAERICSWFDKLTMSGTY